MRPWKFRGYLPLVIVMGVAISGMGAYGKPKANADNKEEKSTVDAVLFLAPLDDLVNLAAGTLEARVSLDYSFDDTLRPAGSRCQPFNFLRIYRSDGLMYGAEEMEPVFSIYMNQVRGAHSLFFENRHYYGVRKSDPSQRFSSAAISGDKEKGPWLLAGEWHAMAVTWVVDKEGLQVELYLDGKSQSRRSFPIKEGGVGSFKKGDFLSVGGETLSAATLLSYRLSNRVRTKEEIASDKPLVADDATTLFMDAGIAEKTAALKRSEFASMVKNKKLNIRQPVFVGEFKIIDTPKGKAIQFYKQKSR
ncbi:MAG: hypothetical protein WCS52_00445 [bacterium]